jgi:four helix bundle protein
MSDVMIKYRIMGATKSVLKEKSFQFAIQVVKLYKCLAEKKEFILSKQLLRSGTAIGALIREAQNAESKADFIHKLGVSQKECDETLYWLELLKETNYITEKVFDVFAAESTALLKMIRSAILTSKQITHNSSFITHNS